MVVFEDERTGIRALLNPALGNARGNTGKDRAVCFLSGDAIRIELHLPT